MMKANISVEAGKCCTHWLNQTFRSVIRQVLILRGRQVLPHLGEQLFVPASGLLVLRPLDVLPISLLRQREGNVAAVNGRLQGRLPRGAGFARGIPAGRAENDVLVIVAASS